jgi:hypothetical protein
MATALRFDHGVSVKMIQMDLIMKDYKKMKFYVTLCVLMVFFTCVATGHARLKSVPVAARSKAWFYGLLGLRVPFPPGA